MEDTNKNQGWTTTGNNFAWFKILHCDYYELALYLASLSIQFTVLVYIDTARNLLSQLNTFNKFHLQDVSLKPLWLLWDETGQWPFGEQERVSKQNEKGNEAEPPSKSINSEGESDSHLFVSIFSPEVVEQSVLRSESSRRPSLQGEAED